VNFLADECCDAALVDALRTAGHDVLYVTESLRGASDKAVLARAFSENRILLTEDKDFGELVYRLHRPAHGIVLLRFDIADRDKKIPRMRVLLAEEAERLPGALVVLESGKVRVRPLNRKIE
jgi:predicted nuclease of predicted toxin-antitoxin system